MHAISEAARRHERTGIASAGHADGYQEGLDRGGDVSEPAPGRLRRIAAGVIALLAGWGGAVPAMADPVPVRPEPGWTIDGTVLLSRHGMRGSTIPVRCGPETKGCLAPDSKDPWPTLDVAAGHLTTAGYTRSVTMGTYYRRLYAAAGLLPPEGCITPSTLEFTSDAVERTVMTAGAVMDGMAPGCGLMDISIRQGLYRGASCGFEKAEAEKASQAFVGGSWQAVAEGKMARSLGVLSRTLGPLPDETCKKHALPAGCHLSDLRATAADAGPLAIAGGSSEQFAMQYGGGMPAGEIGWGRLAEAAGEPLGQAVTTVIATHALYDGAIEMPLYQAAKLGSQTLTVVKDELDDIAAGKGAPFRFLASHDNYILNIGGMLGLSWNLESYHPYQIPPGGSVAFELWRNPEGARFVRLVYRAQTLDQLRDNTALDVDHPPAAQVMVPAKCEGAVAGACPLATFQSLVASAIEPACVAKP
jgi:4-phytase/acid phosphatase